MKNCVLFVQRRTHRAGAQTCLARLLRHEKIRAWKPVVLSSRAGWLTQECARIKIPVVLREFPNSRSLRARLFGNGLFSGRAHADLLEADRKPTIVFANDHQEGLIALSVAKRFDAKSAILLRSPSMRHEDYVKYSCDQFDYVSAIGDDLAARVQEWDSSKKIHVTYDGVLEDEFQPPKQKAVTAPSRLLVIGSPLAWKGWADFTEALQILRSRGVLPKLRIDFTGSMPNVSDNDLRLPRLKGAVVFHFLGRVEAFRELVRQYNLVINPSRMETFGMAAVEVLAAGVPLLSSKTGVMERVQDNPRLLFEPSDPAALAGALQYVLKNWNDIDFGLAAAQANIRRQFMIDHSAEHMHSAFRELVGAS